MNRDGVEKSCSNLSDLLKNTIREKIIYIEPDDGEYTLDEALVFWVADLLSGVKLVTSDQLRLILDEFAPSMLDFGRTLSAAMHDNKKKNKLPSCKIGILDRSLACMDGVNFFVDLKTGKRRKVTEHLPLETVSYNLTTLVTNKLWSNENFQIS